MLKTAAQRWLPRHTRSLHCLCFNSGSSTLKVGLFDVDRADANGVGAAAGSLQGKPLATGLVDRVGKSDASIEINGKVVYEGAVPSHEEGLKILVESLQSSMAAMDVKVVGHRVVHGGSAFSSPVKVDGAVLEKIQEYSVLAPLHNPPAITGLKAAQSLFPDATHVAVFDTAFHSTMPAESYRYAVPASLYEDLQLRKYGFHGTSYKYVSEEAARRLNTPKPNLIILHLGSGASMCCVKGGASVDTTMGLSPLEGLVMGTRSGDLDPGVFSFLTANGYSSADIDTILNKQSGLLGLSDNLSNDMRTIKDAAAAGNADAKLARDVFIERVRKYIGSYLVKLSGDCDAIVFTGGIGENDIELREAVLEGLSSLGIAVDSQKNAVCEVNGGAIHSALSKTKVLVIPTNEELSISLQAVETANVLPQLGEPARVERVAMLSTNAKSNTNETCRSVFVQPLEGCYTADEEVGIMAVLSSKLERCGYFRPFAGINEGHEDFKINLFHKHFNMDCDVGSMYGVTSEEAVHLIGTGKEDELFETILDKYLAYSADKDFVLVSNSKLPGGDGLNWATKIARALKCPVIAVGDVGSEEELAIVKGEFRAASCDFAGAIISGIGQDDGDFDAGASKERSKLSELGITPVALLPYRDELYKQTVAEVVEILDCEVLYGGDLTCGDRVVSGVKVCTLNVGDFLKSPSEKDGNMVITHAKRIDVLMSLILECQSTNGAKYSGLLLTGYDAADISSDIRSILAGLERINVPVLATKDGTFESAAAITDAPIFLTADSHTKLDTSTALMSERLEEDFINRFIDEKRDGANDGDVGPKLFQHAMFSRAREMQKTIVLPEGDDIRVVEAAGILSRRKLCKLELVGNAETIERHASTLGISLEGISVVEPTKHPRYDDMAEQLYALRKSKGMTLPQAKQLLAEDVNYFGTMMMKIGLADGMVSGAAHSTANTIRPPLQIIKMAPGAANVSSIFFMLLDDGVKVMGDCAINVDPTAEQLGEIATASARTAKKFGISPRVALLSYATGDSNSGDLIDKVIKATEQAREEVQRDGFLDPTLIEGPLQFDAAVDPDVAAVKLKGNPVAGRANVLVYPDLTSGNAGYKGVQQASKCLAVGPILQGLAKPVNDLSRGATVGDIVNTAVITCLQTDDGD